VSGVHRNQTVSYLANYPLYKNLLVFFADPDEPPTLFVLLSNHLQFAREMSVIDDVRCAKPPAMRQAVERIREVLDRVEAHQRRSVSNGRTTRFRSQKNEIARLVRYLANPESGYVRSEVINLNRGMQL
jgi:hypothetical protein